MVVFLLAERAQDLGNRIFRNWVCVCGCAGDCVYECVWMWHERACERMACVCGVRVYECGKYMCWSMESYKATYYKIKKALLETTLHPYRPHI